MKEPNGILIIYTFIYDIGEYFEIQDGRKIRPNDL